MTVAECIAKLQTLDPNAHIVTYHDATRDSPPMYSPIEDVTPSMGYTFPDEANPFLFFAIPITKSGYGIEGSIVADKGVSVVVFGQGY